MAKCIHGQPLASTCQYCAEAMQLRAELAALRAEKDDESPGDVISAHRAVRLLAMAWKTRAVVASARAEA